MFSLRKVIALFALVIASAPVTASPLAFTTSYGGGSATDGTSVMAFTNNTVNGAAGGLPANILGATSNLTLTLGSLSGSPVTGPVTPTATFSILNNGHTAVFTFLGLTIKDNGAGQLGILGNAYLSTADAAFGPLNELYSVNITINGASLAAGNLGTFTGVSLPSGSGTFTDTGTIYNPFGDPVPEPMTLAAFGAMTLVGGVYGRRKLKARAVAQA